MRFSVAATVIASTNSLVLAAPTERNPSSTGLAGKGKEKSLSYSAGNDRSPITRRQRAHWTMPRTPTKDAESLPDPLASKSAVLTNQKDGKGDGIDADEYPRDSVADADDQDLGILSPSRHLAPVDYDSSPDSTFFDSFTVFDRDRTNFYSVCDPTVEDEYLCSRCDTNETEKTVSDFECQKVSCYEVYSRCPNNKMVVCRYDTMQRLFDVEPTGNGTTSPYNSEKCRKIEMRLSKTNREMLPSDESAWDFTYCVRYYVASLEEVEDDKANTCEMEIDGIVCNGCSLETVDFAPVNSTDSQQEFCVNFDCRNTLLGYSGRFCNDAGLATSSIDYFIYRSLPCDGGCNLCGNSDDPALMRMVTFPEAVFDTPTNTTSQYLNTLVLPEKLSCFETQWGALTATGGLVCSDLEGIVEASCGCMSAGVPTPEEPAENTTATASDGGEEEVEEAVAGAMLLSNIPSLFTSLVAAWLVGFEIL